MHTDRYTKFILTVIAIGLIANLFAPFLKPTPAIAQGTGKKWSDVQYANVNAYGETKKWLQQGYEPFAAAAGGIYFRK
jgi:hypothetical protein